MNHILLKQFLLLENIWIHIFSMLDIDPQLPIRNILNIDPQLSLRNIHLFKLPFHNKKHPQLEHIEEILTSLNSKFFFKKFSMLS